MQQLICVNKRDFERICRDEGWSDSNPPTDAALISICCNEEVARFVLSDGDAHFFSEDHANVLNVEFDDITEDVKVFDGEEYGFPGKLTARGITPETAEKIVRFIEDHKAMDFLIHCRAGKSRSQGVVRYVLDFYKGPFQTNQSNPCRFYNTHTYTALRKARERLGLC
jgi:hypothetical protein